MGIMSLNPTEKDLFDAVEHGDKIKLKNRGAITAEVLRHIVVGLPLVEEGTGKTRREVACAVTGAGVSIRDAVISGRMNLDAAIGDDGGPICPLEFRKCTFVGGFSGAHASFSRLSFRDCIFVIRGNPIDADTKCSMPTIDLSGAGLNGDLDMRGIRPGREDGLLWIRAPGFRVDGEIDLSGCRLHAPDSSPDRRIADESEDALNLALAEIKGDLRLLDGSDIRGRIKLRGAHVEGDVWMSGATVKCAGGDALFFQGARIDGFLVMDGRFNRIGNQGSFRKFRCMGGLNLRAAEIEHDLYLKNAIVQGALDAGGMKAKEDVIIGAEIRGKVDLRGCRIAGSLDLSGVDLACSVKSVNLNDGNIGRTLTLAQRDNGCRLLKARRGRLASIPGVDLLETLWMLYPEKALWNWRERKDSDDCHLAQAAFLVQGKQIIHLDGHAEALDRAIDAFGAHLTEDTVIEFARLYGAHVIGEQGALRIIGCPPWVELAREKHWPTIRKCRSSFFAPTPVRQSDTTENGKAKTNNGQAGALEQQQAKAGVVFAFTALVIQDDCLARWRFEIDAETGSFSARPSPKGRKFELKAAPRFTNGLIVPPLLPKEEAKSLSNEEDWLSSPALEGLSDHQCSSRLKDSMRPYIQPRPVLQAVFDLEGLTCDMLDDHAGRAWGTHLDKIRMNHFVYHRTTWEPEDPKNRKALSVRPIKGFRKRMEAVGRAVRPTPPKGYWASFKSLARRAFAGSRNGVNRIRAQRLPVWISWLFNLSEGLRVGDHWKSIEKKRNWLYRQFDTAGLSSSSKYQVRSADYRSQPFEQAIRVARTEGREDYAIYFEILKERIEWSIFIARNIFWFVVVGVVAAVAWYLLAPPRIEPLARWTVALLILLGVSVLPSVANWVMRWGFGYLRRPSRAVSTLIIAFLIGWAGVSAANKNRMLVIDVAPVADIVGGTEQSMRMGSTKGNEIVRNVHCDDTINEALYALDVLIPLVDLRQESRCEVERAEIIRGTPAERERWRGESPPPGEFDWDEALWKVMKALYAIAGWLLVSLSILTFARINRAPAEPTSRN